jgi:nucleotide-binding universal stress UspA family protein
VSKPILVGYDPDRRDYAPIEVAVTVARFTGAELIVALAAAESAPVIGLAAEAVEYAIGQVDPDLLPDSTPAIEHVEPQLRAAGVKVDFLRLRSTSAARGLQEAAEEVDAGLLVVGSSRRSGAGRVLAGATAQRLLHGAPCPVAVAPASWAAEGKPDTVGVGFVDTEEGHQAVRSAHALARGLGAKLRVVNVVEAPVHEVAEQVLRKAVELLEDGVAVETDVLVGLPADLLIEESERVDLLVLGARGYGPLRAVLLGSVSRRVMEEARCPVIVLPRGVKHSLTELEAESPSARVRAS